MQRINEDIKNNRFSQTYLLFGEEAYLRKQYKDKLKAALCADGDTMNYHYFEGKQPLPERSSIWRRLCPFWQNAG